MHIYEANTRPGKPKEVSREKGGTMLKKIVYFEQKGSENTDEVLSIVKSRIKEGDIKEIVLASTRGETAKTAVKVFADAGLKKLGSDLAKTFKYLH